MGYPYIGDRQLDPDDEFSCPFCQHVATSRAGLILHVSRCPENEGIEAPEPYPEEEV